MQRRTDLDIIALRLAAWLAEQLPSHDDDRDAFYRDARSVCRRARPALDLEQAREATLRRPRRVA